MTVEVIQKVAVNAILPNPYQPLSRINIDMLTAQKFAESIKEHGLLQIPICRKNTDKKLEMGDGWLRLAGYKWLARDGKDYEMIDVIVKDMTDRQMADLVLEANTVRQDLNPIEIAQFYKKYLEDFDMTQEELGKQHGITQGEVANTLRLLDLPPEIQKKVISQEISPTHGRTLLQLKDPEKMIELAGKIKDRNWSVADLSVAIRETLTPPKQVPLAALDKEPVKKERPLDDPEEETTKTAGKIDKPSVKSAETPTEEPEKTLQKVTMEELKASAKLRKVVLEEKLDGVLVMVSHEGGMPFMKKVTCDLADTPLKLILEEAK